jgi:hypothetical protein
MEKRPLEKIHVNLYVKIILGGETYYGYIDDVAQEGDEYLITCVIKVSKNFTPEKIAKIYFQIPSGETINLSCAIRWFLISQYDNKTEVIGMKIMNPPAKYEEFIRSLNLAPEIAKQELSIDNVNHEYESSYKQINDEDEDSSPSC